MTLSVEEAAARVPQWMGKDIQTSFLAGGITNQNYKVETGGEAFVLRICGENTELLGVNRAAEYAANNAAASIGIAPQVVHVIEPEQYLVTQFINGKGITPEEIGLPPNIRRIAEALKQIHTLPPVDNEFNAFRFVENGAKTARSYQVAFPDNFDWLMTRIHEIETAIAGSNTAMRLCHNDLLNANFLIDEGDKLYVLDWEYAGMGDPFFDLANFAANHEFGDEQDHLLLQAYFGDITRQNDAHLKLMRSMSDAREAMWSMVQIGVSKLDFDFHEYADRHFARMAATLNDARYKQWLEDVK